MRYLAIDYGTKRTGLAVCDRQEMLTSPLKVLQGQGNLIRDICSVIEEEGIEGVVVGIPFNMDDTEGPQAKKTRIFAEELRKYVEIPIYFQDERLSSFEAEDKLAGLELTRKQKKRHIDAIAAAAILRSFLESKQA